MQKDVPHCCEARKAAGLPIDKCGCECWNKGGVPACDIMVTVRDAEGIAVPGQTPNPNLRSTLSRTHKCSVCRIDVLQGHLDAAIEDSGSLDLSDYHGRPRVKEPWIALSDYLGVCERDESLAKRPKPDIPNAPSALLNPAEEKLLNQALEIENKFQDKVHELEKEIERLKHVAVNCKHCKQFLEKKKENCAQCGGSLEDTLRHMRCSVCSKEFHDGQPSGYYCFRDHLRATPTCAES